MRSARSTTGCLLPMWETGLRTYNLERPFPEEGLRNQGEPRAARFHLVPTHRARAALQAEGIADEFIHRTGNTVIDAQMSMCAPGCAPARAGSGSPAGDGAPAETGAGTWRSAMPSRTSRGSSQGSRSCFQCT